MTCLNDKQDARARHPKTGRFVTVGGDQVSCSHGCLPRSVKSNKGELSAEKLLEQIFKTSLALENFYWCPSWEPAGGRCTLPPANAIKKREGSCTLDGCLYTGPAADQVDGKGLCDNNVEDNDNWSCKFRVCTSDGCNYSAAPSTNTAHGLAVVVCGMLSLALTVAHRP